MDDPLRCSGHDDHQPAAALRGRCRPAAIPDQRAGRPGLPRPGPGTAGTSSATAGSPSCAGFLTPAAVRQMIAEADRLAGRAWASDQSHTVYFEPPDDSAGADHPRALLQHSAKKAVAYDLIPDGAPIRRLYESDDLTAFIAAVLGKQVLYRSADPLDALEIAVFGDGDELGWHFDNSEFSVTVMYSEVRGGRPLRLLSPAARRARRELPRRPEGPAGRPGRRRQAAQQPGHARGLPRPARPAPGHPGQRPAAADQLGADLRRAPGHEAEPAHPGAVLRPHRLSRPGGDWRLPPAIPRGCCRVGLRRQDGAGH